ncbi:MAG TPA: ABC transporter, partial [Isosphaeraceae bacterium]|nr:ABC transporter [Isosphaeraceae bacterium]
MFGPQQAEPKGDLSPLLAMLNLEWPSTEIVWDTYNPHPQLDFPVEYVFIGEGSGAPHAFSSDPVTSGLQEVLLLFSGLLRERSTDQEPKFEPLLRTSDLGGTLGFDEAILRGPFGMSRVQPDRPHFATGQSYVLAARISGPPADSATLDANQASPADVNVIAVADLDMISDMIFDLRRRPVESLDIFDFDNVTFILNAVDVLAGDETFVDLRKKRPKHRTLTALEDESKKFIDQSQLEQKKAEDTAKEQLEAARTRLQEAVDKIRTSEEYDERTKESMVRYRQQVEERRLELAEAQIEAQKLQQIEESRARREQAIDSIENRVRAQALALTPLPPLVLGLVIFVLRKSRENRGAN